MSSSKSILSALVEILGRALAGKGSSGRRSERSQPRATLRPDGRETSERDTSTRQPRQGSGRDRQRRDEEATAGRDGDSRTIQVDPARVKDVNVDYAPSDNDQPDSGEVIWTWVPYEENDGRGKDRPVLVIGRQSADRVYAVRMTSKAHDRDRDYLSIGSGGWDSQGRESWVDIEQLYSVHTDGMRREAAVLDRARYRRVAQALMARYGWAHA